VSKAYLKSPIGTLEIVASENGICEINFVDKFEKIAIKDENLKLCLDELEAYFKGELKKFSVRLDIKTTNFRAKISRKLAQFAKLSSNANSGKFALKRAIKTAFISRKGRCFKSCGTNCAREEKPK